MQADKLGAPQRRSLVHHRDYTYLSLQNDRTPRRLKLSLLQRDSPMLLEESGAETVGTEKYVHAMNCFPRK